MTIARRPSAEDRDTGAPSAGRQPGIGVVVVAYNAAGTLAQVLDRIPQDFRDRVAEVIVCDDHSADSTYLVGLGYQAQGTDLPITMVRHPHNLGYGGNQKAAYRLASEHGLDIVVLLHGDGQYAPELLPEMVAPLARGECDAVFGSRMMQSGGARRGGMPLYKYLGNRVLTRFENKMLGTSLSEFHSGYRAYKVSVLDQLNLDACSDGFDFDTQIIIQLHDARRRMLEIPIPTYYGDEICYVNGMSYARDISLEALKYGLGRRGFGVRPRCLPRPPEHAVPYELKPSDRSSHGRLLTWLAALPASRVLDVGCSGGLFGEQARLLGHHVTGVDVEKHEGVVERLDEFVLADLEQGLPEDVGAAFDVVVMADVLEHVRHPGALLEAALGRLAPGGRLLVSVPNFGHWYPRARTLVGRFDYDERGILDRGHVRFFTRRSFERLARSQGLVVRRRQATGLPIDVLGSRQGATSSPPPPSGRRGLWRTVERIDDVLVRLRPELFAYQLIYELEPQAPRTASS